MSDRIAAHITIGGKLSRSKLPILLKAITEADAATNWGDAFFQPQSEQELLCVLMNGRLWLCDDESSDGHFPELEEPCRKLGLSYTRYCESRYGYDALLVDWRPGMRRPLTQAVSNVNQTVYVSLTRVRRALKLLEAGRVEPAKAALRRLCPILPKLPPFQIV